MPIWLTSMPGNDWNDADLLFLKIILGHKQGADFFGGQPGPIDHLDPNLLLPLDHFIGADMSKEAVRFLANLQFAYYGDINQQGALHEFTAMMLQAMRYDEHPVMLRRHFDISFVKCGETVVSTTDIGLYHCHKGLILLVVRIASRTEENYTAQVIADAIAAFQHNNKKRVEWGLPCLAKMVIPCITMSGSRPYFYKVPVTQDLGYAVADGQRPNQSTFVHYCTPPFWRGTHVVRMEEPEYRQTVLEYCEAFHGFAKDCWSHMLSGM